MRIGIVSGEYPPMQGGVGAFSRELALALGELGSMVEVFTRAQAGSARGERVSVSGLVAERWGWGTLAQVRRWARDQRLELLNIQFQTAAYDLHPAIHWLPRQMRSTGIATVTTFHDLRVPYLFPKAGPLREGIVRLLARSSAGVIATDHGDEARLRDDWRIPCVRWIPIGSNVTAAARDTIDRDAIRAGLGVRGDQLLISYFGFLNETKGGLTLIQALAELVRGGVDAQLVMIGGRAGASDPTNQEYGRRVDEAIAANGLSERVHWSGFVDDAAVSGLFFASDITAHPYAEGASLRRGTLMAALAHGRAIVTTRPVSAELKGAVEAVEPGDPTALGAAMRGLWEDSARRELLERAALAASAQFTWASIARSTLDYYQEILAR